MSQVGPSINGFLIFIFLQTRGKEGFDGDFDEESTMVEDSVSPSKLVTQQFVLNLD